MTERKNYRNTDELTSEDLEPRIVTSAVEAIYERKRHPLQPDPIFPSCDRGAFFHSLTERSEQRPEFGGFLL
ncbi:hypothetical protein FHX16_004153 [Rhizobium sp. BK661]|nr:hypothetical protein [Rhizobium sp. BK661]